MLPKQFWTKTLKVIMVLYLVGGGIGFLISAIVVQTWWIAPIGWIATFLSSAIIGTLIEISENTAERLEAENSRESYFMKNADDPYVEDKETSSDPYSILNNHSEPENNTSPQKPVTYEKKDYWICPACGESNNLNDVICKRCNEQVWVCPRCGKANNFDNESCLDCGWQA